LAQAILAQVIFGSSCFASSSCNSRSIRVSLKVVINKMQAQQELLQEGEVKCLGCVGATPFSIFCVWIVLGFLPGSISCLFGLVDCAMSMLALSAESLAALRVTIIFRILEAIGILTSSLGIYYLKKRSKNQQKIPRNNCCCCLLCCNCPFLPWSLVVASALDILLIVLGIIFGAFEDALWYAFLVLIACLVDGTFGVIWLKLLMKQDPTEGICCSNNHVQNAVPIKNSANTNTVTVVGLPIQASAPPTQMTAQGAPVEEKV